MFAISIWALVLIATIVVLTLASTLFLAMLFSLLAEQRVWQPALVAVVMGVATVFVMARTWHGAPGIDRFITVPLFVASVSGAMCLRKRHLDALGALPTSGGRWRDAVVIVCGLLGAFLAASTELGKRLLLSLGYDVIGNTSAEIWEGRIAGGVVGLVAGAAAALIAWGIFARR